MVVRRAAAAKNETMIEPDIAILGAGAWGTALSVTLARAGRHVTLCVRRSEQLNRMAQDRENRAYLPGIELPRSLAITLDWAQALGRCRTVIVAIPSSFVRAILTPLVDAIPHDATFISATKGLEERSHKTMSQALAELLPHGIHVAALSGPGFAAEVARGRPAALVAAARDEQVAGLTQRLLAVPFLRVYRSTDVLGVELGGAIKNVIAIAAGISDGLELGSSARAALITRGLAEMMRLGTAMGARRETLAGLSGLGDLILTCTGELSRNRAYGLRIGQGMGAHGPGAEPAREGTQIAEGAANARLVAELGARWNVELPIVAAVCRCLYEEQAPQAMVEGLFSRELKAEF
jgi:glycerol-3-phosphate dehydrogenase (NAD(P)+)